MRVLLAGAAMAAAAGMVLGDAMRPVLWDPDAPLASLAAAWPQSESRPSDAWAAYRGVPPDYVIGTDWVPRPYAEATPDPARMDRASSPPAEEPHFVAAVFDEPPAATPAYPSESGDILAGVRPEPPPAPAEAGLPPA